MARKATAHTRPAGAPDMEVAVIGAGPGGLAVAVQLQKAGITDFTVLERATDVGGSWHENTYPGLSVDIPSIAYQYSFARNANWSRFFAPGPEVKQYHVDVAKRFKLYEHIRFNTNVLREEWDEDRHLWKLHTEGGEVITARFVVSAVGAFVRPKEDPGIPGLKTFGGKIQRPSNWDHGYDLAGKKVGVIGTGASSVQIVPAIADQVGSMTVFQRTPVWCVPKPDFPMPGVVQAMLKIPGLQAFIHGVVLVVVDLGLRIVIVAPMGLVKPVLRTMDRAAKAAYKRYLKVVVKDPETRKKLMPNYGPATKRPTMNTFYTTTFNRPNVELVTERIERFTKKGIRTADGVEHEFDVVVLATGYEVFSDPETWRKGTVAGRDGFDLGEFWGANGLQAYESVAVPKLPNRWTLVGPYSWTGSGWHAFVEMYAAHAVRAISEARKRGATLVEIRKQVHDAYHALIYQRSEPLRYYLCELNGHVPSYYRNSQGDSTYLRPTSFLQARHAAKHFPLDHYSFEALPAESLRLVSSNGKHAAKEQEATA